MSYSWFKVHHDILLDTRMRKFSAQEKWAWIVLLSLASSNQESRGTVQGDDEDLADQCEFNTTQDWLYYKDKLKTKGMVDITPTGLSIIGWERIQACKPSQEPDATRDRKRKERSRKPEPQNPQIIVEKEEMSRDVTPLSRDVTRCHEDVTPCHATDKNRSEEKRLDQTRQEETRQDTQEPIRAIACEAAEALGPEASQEKEPTPYNLDPMASPSQVLAHYGLNHLADGRRSGSQARFPNWNEKAQKGVTARCVDGRLGSGYKESPLVKPHETIEYLDRQFAKLKQKDDAVYLEAIRSLEAAYKAGEMALEAKKAVEVRESTQRPFRVVSTLEKLESDLEQAEKERTDLNAEGSNPPGWLNRRIKDLSEAVEAEKNSSQGSVAA